LQSEWKVHGVPWNPGATGRKDGEQERGKWLLSMSVRTRQEAFLRLYTALRNDDQIRQPKFWVYKVARNIAINAAQQGALQSAFSETLEATVATANANVLPRSTGVQEHWSHSGAPNPRPSTNKVHWNTITIRSWRRDYPNRPRQRGG
jgi:hypothetical protein